jgi:magnesium-transporting ATPase (P-type)
MGYWSKSPDEVFRELATSRDGLSTAAAEARLRQYGLNDFPKRRERSAVSLLAAQITDLLVAALIIASVVSFVTGGEVEAITIAAIVLVNIGVGFTQEYKSEKALQKLALLIRYTVNVVRDARVVAVDTRDIVPGDVVLLETGDRVPADLRLTDVDELEIDESIVTGESYPVHKSSRPLPADTLEPQQMENMAFVGTLVVNGKGKGVVVSTGMTSTLGRVVTYLKLVEPETNYQKGIRGFSTFLVKGILVGVTFIFIMNAVTGKTFMDSALFSLALAVGIIPESLPIIITIGLSRGAIRTSATWTSSAPTRREPSPSTGLGCRTTLTSTASEARTCYGWRLPACPSSKWGAASGAPSRAAPWTWRSSSTRDARGCRSRPARWWS